jgi:hypothetical protein
MVDADTEEFLPPIDNYPTDNNQLTSSDAEQECYAMEEEQLREIYVGETKKKVTMIHKAMDLSCDIVNSQPAVLFNPSTIVMKNRMQKNKVQMKMQKFGKNPFILHAAKRFLA